MHEYVGNLHMHTTTSDGHGTHDEVADAAIRAGLDFIFITDHNVLPTAFEGYHYRGFDRILRLIGEEVHDPARSPERSHLLIYGANEGLSRYAESPQTLIREATRRGALSFLAHPSDCGVPGYDQPDLSWEDWEVEGYTGIELWNFMTSFKCLLRSRLHATFYGLFPNRIRRGPEQDLLDRFDQLLGSGQRIVIIGGVDAHALPFRAGPLRRTVFPYEWLFQTVNTHVLIENPLEGEVQHDKESILSAIERGNCFVGYDLPADTKGFMFSAHSEFGNAVMGDRLRYELGATVQVRTPAPAEIRLIHQGRTVQRWSSAQHGVVTINSPGAYRVEADLSRSGTASIPWIYSNPIYIEKV